MNGTTTWQGLALDWNATIVRRFSLPPLKAKPVPESQARDEATIKRLCDRRRGHRFHSKEKRRMIQ